MTVEIGGPTESAKLIDWMWFHTMPPTVGRVAAAQRVVGD
jgi:hypothetical protein